MTDHEFQQTLRYLGLSLAELAELLAVNARTTRRWADDPSEIPGPAEQALRAWVRLQRLGLAWRPDGIAIGERSSERIAEQIKLYLRNAVDPDALVQRVERRGGPAAPWAVSLASRQASFGSVVVSFYPLVNGGFSPASYTRRDRAPDLERDWPLIEDALTCIAKAVSAAGPDWAGQPGEPIFPFGDTVHVPSESARQVLDKGDRLFRETLATLTDLGEAERAAFAAGTQEIALAIDGTVPEYAANESFLDLVLSANPGFYVDSPLWIDTRFQDARFQPRVTNGAWQTLFVSAGQQWPPWDTAEFHHLDPRGRFFLRRMLDDDSLARARNFAAGDYLDPHHAIARTAEAIAVGQAFARAMQCDPAATRLAFAFRWSSLTGRVIHSWTGFGRFPPKQQYKAMDDEAEGLVEVPLSTPPGALTPFVERATASLFAQFGGFEVPVGFTSTVVRNLIEKA